MHESPIGSPPPSEQLPSSAGRIGSVLVVGRHANPSSQIHVIVVSQSRMHRNVSVAPGCAMHEASVMQSALSTHASPMSSASWQPAEVETRATRRRMRSVTVTSPAVWPNSVARAENWTKLRKIWHLGLTSGGIR